MDELNSVMKVPQLDVDNTQLKDIPYPKTSFWKAQTQLLSMTSNVFAELNFSGYIIISKDDFSVQLKNKSSRRILKLAFTSGSLDDEFGNDYLLERLKDGLSYGYAQLSDESKNHIGFLNVLHGEVFDENGDIADIGLTMNLVVGGYDSIQEHDNDLFVITSTLLGAVSALLQSIQDEADSK